MRFQNRSEAGKQLVKKLNQYKNSKDTIVLGLPRGGIVTAFEISKILNLPLDIVVPRKIGAPDNPEFAVGAITEEGKGIFHDAVINAYQISEEYLVKEIQKQRQEAERRVKLYRGNRPALDLEDKIVILVDDGIATGATVRAAILSIQLKKPAKVIIAVPVMAREIYNTLQGEVDEIITLFIPPLFMSVGQFYEHFDQVEDREVIQLLR